MPQPGRAAGVGRRAGRAAARPLRRPPLAGEGDPRVPRCDGGAAARDRRRRPGRRSPRRSASSRTPSSAPTTSAPPSSACPSRREGYGVVAREAMAYGRPVVATRVGGLADAIEDGETGLLVPPGDVPRAPGRIGAPARDAELRASPRRGGACACVERLSLRRRRPHSSSLYQQNVRVAETGALITGIGGQDGSLLAELLLEQGYEVFGVVRGPRLGARTTNLDADPRPDRAAPGRPARRGLARRGARDRRGRTRSTTSPRPPSSRCPGSSPC